MGALDSSNGATVVRRGRLARVFGLVTTRIGLRLPQIARSTAAPVGCGFSARP